MADPGERQVSRLLAGLAAILPTQRPRADEIETGISQSETLEKTARAALGFYSQATGLAGPPHPERWQALYLALAAALVAQEGQQVGVAVSSLEAALKRLAAEESMRWVAFVPLESAVDQVTQPSYAFDRPGVRACLVPPLLGNLKHLQDVQFQFGTAALTVAEDVTSSALALLVSGSETRAAERALARFADVRDAARAAWLLASEKPRAPASSLELATKWVTVNLVRVDGSVATLHPLRASDVRLEVDPGSLLQPGTRTFYGQLLNILAAPSATVAGRDGQQSPEARLGRSVRVIARTWVQSSFDVRYLLYLVALESLIPGKEDITDAVADIGARLLASELPEREALDRQLRSAYNIRSRFVHDGELSAPDALSRGGAPVTQLQELVLRVWSPLARNYLELIEHNASGAQLEAVLSEFRGKTISRYAYGTTWADATKHVLKDN